MNRPKECPKCGEDISESHMDEDPECGIHAGWYCDKCDEAYPDEEDDYDYDYDE